MLSNSKALMPSNCGLSTVVPKPLHQETAILSCEMYWVLI